MEDKKQKINLLSAELANQIAAGEVVERPSSVLKELVENSLDAEATSVFAMIEDGGQACIKVSDNGIGIPFDQLTMALTRYGTSKIQNVGDLSFIKSYGFRGEALPSIASVSKFKIASYYKYAQDKQGYALEVLFGENKEISPHIIQEGTQIEVRDLFNNIPARLKFLKNPNTELKKAQEIFTRIALIKEKTAFTLNAGTREIFSILATEDMYQRLSHIWAPHITESLLEVNHNAYGIRVYGYISHPRSLYSKADKVLFYVNGRPVADKILYRAVRQAYQKNLTTKDFPQALLCVDLPFDEVDVNVHPAKSEVRFRDEQTVFKAVLFSLEKVLSTTLFVHKFENNDKDTKNRESVAVSSPISLYSSSPSFSPFNHGKKLISSGYESFNRQTSRLDTLKSLQSAAHEINYSGYSAATSFGQGEESSIASSQVSGMCLPQYIGQVESSYLLFLQATSVLFVLDQHAVHERILYERYKKNPLRQSQVLLMSLFLPLHESEVENYKALESDFKKLGFECEYKDDVIEIMAIPIEFDKQSASLFLRTALENNTCNLDALWIDHACDVALKANQKISKEEAYTLYSQWLSCDEPDYCPHGRPCYVLIDALFFEKLFKRS